MFKIPSIFELENRKREAPMKNNKRLETTMKKKSADTLTTRFSLLSFVTMMRRAVAQSLLSPEPHSEEQR